jgi:hypothetical protein
VAGHHVEALRGGGPVQRRDHVGDRGRHRDVARCRLHEGLLRHRHPAAGGGGRGLQLLGHPGRGGADAAHRVGLAGCGVPAAELGEPQHRGVNAGRVHLPQQRAQVSGRGGSGRRAWAPTAAAALAGVALATTTGAATAAAGRGGQEHTAAGTRAIALRPTVRPRWSRTVARVRHPASPAGSSRGWHSGPLPAAGRSAGCGGLRPPGYDMGVRTLLFLRQRLYGHAAVLAAGGRRQGA